MNASLTQYCVLNLQLCLEWCNYSQQAKEWLPNYHKDIHVIFESCVACPPTVYTHIHILVARCLATKGLIGILPPTKSILLLLLEGYWGDLRAGVNDEREG